jgi:phosphate starvation-inducible PhoH-like protein
MLKTLANLKCPKLELWINISIEQRGFFMCRKRERSKLELLVDDKSARQEGANKKKFHPKDLTAIQPLTHNQSETFVAYNSGFNLFLSGSAGTGKTFISMYLALREVLETSTPYDTLVIVRSVVSTRDFGFLPGSEEEKQEPYEKPYMGICDRLFRYANTYRNLKKLGYVEFTNTSHLRGTTYDNCIILVDESENMNDHELDSIITRIGKNCKIIFSGDSKQTDLLKSNRDQSGHDMFKTIVNRMKSFRVVNFTIDDIVRSDLVKDYLITRERLNL